MYRDYVCITGRKRHTAGNASGQYDTKGRYRYILSVHSTTFSVSEYIAEKSGMNAAVA